MKSKDQVEVTSGFRLGQLPKEIALHEPFNS